MKEDMALEKEQNVNQEKEMELIVKEVADVLRDDKAFDILVLNIGKLTSITDIFVICTATSSVQIKALIRDIDELLHRRNLRLVNSVDNLNSPWVLLDYNYFVIHIFLKEGRDFYKLERLWSDAEIIYNSNKEKGK